MQRNSQMMRGTMKTGDVVKLSSYGRGLACYKSIGDSLGIITEVCELEKSYYFVWWLCGDKTLATRRDLKYIRGTSE